MRDESNRRRAWGEIRHSSSVVQQMGLESGAWVEPSDRCERGACVCFERMLGTPGCHGDRSGAVAVARKVVRVEACHLKKQTPSCGPGEAPGGFTHREVIMGKRRSRCLSFHC